MQKIIMQKLLIVAICGVLLSAAVFFALQTLSARNAADRVSVARLGEAAAKLSEYSETREQLTDVVISRVLWHTGVGETGYLFAVLSETGHIVTHPYPELIGTVTPEMPFESGVITLSGQKLRYNALDIANYTLVSAFPMKDMYRQRTYSVIYFLFITTALFVTLCIVIHLYLKTKVVSGIHSILSTLDKITGGDLDVSADVHTNPEFNRLSDGINHMLSGIKTRMTEVSISRLAAEDASRAKSKFLAHMSHEIRTPMNGIIGFSELALDSGVTPEKKDGYLRQIRRSGESLLHIINDILDISKIEAGRLELDNIPFNMHEVFSACQTIVMPLANEKGLSLYCYAEPSVGKKLLGDPARLRQAMLNLLSNAVKFTNYGMIKLMAAITGTTEDSVTIHFEVKDSGIGMTQEQQARIFEPFMQADDSTTRKYGGTGLGIPITVDIVRMMGGELEVVSAPGVGSCFSFTLTFKTIDDSDAAAEILVIDETEAPRFNGEVLLCEDNKMNQQVILEHLKRAGLSVVIAENGRECVNIVTERLKSGSPFDLILMDIHMPVMDGLEATAALNASGSTTPVVAVTANAMTNDRELYLSHGISDHLAKPFKKRELLTCLIKYLTPVGVYENATSPEPSAAVPDSEEAVRLFSQLEQLLRLGSTASLDLTDALREYRGTQTLVAQIRNYDFEIALETLNRLKRT